MTAFCHPEQKRQQVMKIQDTRSACNRMNLKAAFLLLMVAGGTTASAVNTRSCVSTQPGTGRFPLFAKGVVAPVYVSNSDHAGVLKVAGLFLEDIAMVTGKKPGLIFDAQPQGSAAIIAGTIGMNPVIDRLIEEGTLDVRGIAGRWETYLVRVVEKPLPGLDRALVIAGSDKRGTIYGMFGLSLQMGVSPWYWWADVPVKKKDAVYVLPGRHTDGEPAVKYRGIFINDEAPALSGLALEKFGGFNHEFYEHVFELILRLRGNYLWPAMWGRAFYDDDPENPVLANEYGIVIGTSHHEPLMRAHDEWRRYGSGPWNYEKNPDTLRAFWKKGMERMDGNESVVTVGMRGDGDEPMTQGTAISLLERIVRDQRRIIEEVTGKKAGETPQVWALYKEVQDYYDKGMRVPDDVTLLLCDDNWGNIRKLPHRDSTSRTGGYGIYYHFDYVGGPRNYKWLNTNQIERTWEQMHLAWQYGADRLWIVNVGDIKPMEFPIEFFLDYAWDPARWPAERLPEYYTLWSEEQFGKDHAREIGRIIATYTRYNSRRKPELLDPSTYSLVNYREAERVVRDYRYLASESATISASLSPEYKDAYFQLVDFPVKACANLNELYATAGENRMYATQHRTATNQAAEKVRHLFTEDSLLTVAYHRLKGGKWNHMMSQTHIGYTYWQEPRHNNMPAVEEITVPEKASMGIAIEGSDKSWPGEAYGAVLPEFNPWNRQSGYYVEVFNKGASPFDFTATATEDWVRITPDHGRINLQERLRVSIDWNKVPEGRHEANISVRGAKGETIAISVPVRTPSPEERKTVSGFVESNGCISIEASHYSRATEVPPLRWVRIPGLGRSLDGMEPMPVTAESREPGGKTPCLEYPVYLFSAGTIKVRAHLSPTLNFHNDQGLRYAVSLDNQPAVIVNINGKTPPGTWDRWVSNNINITTSEHRIDRPGRHILKFWMVDPAVVLQKLEIVTGDLAASYLGPVESRFVLSGAEAGDTSNTK